MLEIRLPCQESRNYIIRYIDRRPSPFQSSPMNSPMQSNISGDRMLSPTKFGQRRVPPGPTEQYRSMEGLFHWMNENFVRYGDIYKASVFGSDVYVVSAPEYCEHILRSYWRNYPRKGQVVKRIALLIGNGLIASNGEFWKSQRQMIQPAFSKSAIAGLTNIITSVNAELLQNWK